MVHNIYDNQYNGDNTQTSCRLDGKAYCETTISQGHVAPTYILV